MTKKTALALLCLLLLGTPSLAAGDEDAHNDAPRLPLPRFASLRSDKVNMRTGPGTRYPIEWVYARKNLPVEIVAEYDLWRRVRDPEGTVGWIHKNELTGRRMVIVTGEMRSLRDGHDADAPIVAHIQAGAIGQIVSCAPVWCKLNFGGTKGFMPKAEFWGAYDKEEFN